MLANIGRLNEREDAIVLVAISPDGAVMGGCVYFPVMANYNPLSLAHQETNASGNCFAQGNGHVFVILLPTQAIQKS
jgi:hypothetical protein